MKLKKQIAFTYIISVCLFAVIGLLTWKSFQYLLEKNHLVNHTNEVLSVSEKTISHLKDLETGQRGFLLTADSTFLEPFFFFMDSLANDITSLRVLTADNEIQQRRIDTLQDNVGQRLVIFRGYERILASADNGEMIQAQLKAGNAKMKTIRGLIRRIQKEENRLLIIRRNEFEGTIVVLKAVIIGLVAGLFTFIGVSFVFLSRQIRRNQKSAEEIQLLNFELAHTNEELRSAHEEVVAANEEIRAFNEELTSTNEELITGNEELRNAKELIEQLNSDINRRLVSILEHTVDFVSYTDHKKRPVYINPAGMEMLGIDDNFDLSQIFIRDFHPKEVFHIWDEAVLKVNKEGFWQGETMIKSVSGEIIPVWQQIMEHKGNNGAENYYSTIIRDLREMKKAQQELVDSEKRYKTMFDNNPQPMWVIDRDTLQFVEVNNTAVYKYGYSREDFFQMTLMDIRPPEDFEKFRSLEIEKLKGFGVAKGLRHITKEGILLDVEVAAYSFVSGGRNCVLALINDITDKKTAENKLIQINRELVYQNEQLDKYTYVISHNIRGPVATLLGLVEVFDNEKNDVNFNLTVIDLIKKVTEKLDDVILDLNQVLSLKNESQLVYEHMLFQDLVDNVSVLLAEQIQKGGAEISCDFSTVSGISAIKSYMQSIFINLISNAVKYARPNVPPRIHISSDRINDLVLVSFKDNGLGIDLVKNVDKIFGLYKRFHFHVDGKGIGLHLVKIQAEAMEGRIEIESKPGEGSTFKLWLPAAN